MKLRKWLTQEQAKKLDLKPKNNEKGRNQARYMVTPEEWAALQNENRLDSKEVEVSVMSAFDGNHKVMDIDEYCDYYSLPRHNVKSWKLVSHTGMPYYNIEFKEGVSLDTFDYLSELKKQLKGYKSPKLTKKGSNKGVITLTDFHFGAYISSMNITPEFSISILCDMLNLAADKVNKFKYDIVHVHLLGDLIESFTGLNHKNSWKGLDKGMFGVSAIKLFVKLFKENFLDKVNNLGKIKMVAGNHDRVTSDNNEDTDGGAAELVSWGLDMIGYDVEFKRDVLTHKVDNVNYILNHGHLDFTRKKTTQEICWMFGEKGVFNFIMEGHLHSRIQKLSANQTKNFKMIMDDSIDCRRQVCPSLFTGNSYSEDGGWSTMAGFLITEENTKGTGVDVYDISI